MPHYSITTPEAFCNFLVLPFSALVKKDANFEIRIYQKAPGILDQVIKRKFLNYPQCIVNFHHI